MTAITAASSDLDVNRAVITYLACWNERDAGRRKTLVEATWSKDGSFRDPDKFAVGGAEISELIGQAQQRFPNYQLRLVSGIDAQKGFARFSWAAGGAPE